MKKQDNYPIVDSAATTESHYQIILGEKVYLSDEMQKEWNQYINRVHNKAFYAKTCAQPDYRCCCGDCCVCKFARKGRFVSLDDLIMKNKDDDKDPLQLWRDGDSVSPIEDMMITRERMETIYEFASDKAKQGDEILRLYFEEHMTFDEIASCLGEPRTTVQKRYYKLLALLREHKEILN